MWWSEKLSTRCSSLTFNSAKRPTATLLQGTGVRIHEVSTWKLLGSRNVPVSGDPGPGLEQPAIKGIYEEAARESSMAPSFSSHSKSQPPHTSSLTRNSHCFFRIDTRVHAMCSDRCHDFYGPYSTRPLVAQHAEVTNGR